MLTLGGHSHLRSISLYVYVLGRARGLNAILDCLQTHSTREKPSCTSHLRIQLSPPEHALGNRKNFCSFVYANVKCVLIGTSTKIMCHESYMCAYPHAHHVYWRCFPFPCLQHQWEVLGLPLVHPLHSHGNRPPPCLLAALVTMLHHLHHHLQ